VCLCVCVSVCPLPHDRPRYYIHGHPRPPHDARFEGTWRALSELVAAGSIKALGLSNYNKRALADFFDGPDADARFPVKPAVLQVWGVLLSRGPIQKQ